MTTKLSTLILSLGTTLLPAAEISLAPEKLAPVIQDQQDFQIPDRVQMGGWIGSRIAANEGKTLAYDERTAAERKIKLGELRPGKWRTLTEPEIKSLIGKL